MAKKPANKGIAESGINVKNTDQREHQEKQNRKKTSEEGGWNISRARLENTPFQKVSELKAAERAIKLETWNRIQAYKAFSKELTQERNSEVKQDFETGFVCIYAEKGEASERKGETILSVYKAGLGFEIMIHETKPTSEAFVANLAGKMSYSFGTLFYEISGLKRINTPSNETAEESQSKA